MKKNTKGRVWSFIAYPESVPNDWERILSENLNLKWARSPLHDSDLNADDTQKKSHWHIVLVFECVKSYEQILTISKKINGTNPQQVHNFKGLLRYFIHLDNPEKAQYEIKDIYSNGINVEQEILGTSDYEEKIEDEIIEIIEKYDFVEYWDLITFLKMEYKEHKRYAAKHTIFFNACLKSRRYRKMNPLKNI